MDARILTIEGKLRPSPTALASLNDFAHREGEPISPCIVLEQPNISLYCLDHENRRGIFVETAPHVDLSAAPFYYQAQYEAAQRLIAVPYDLLHELASEVRIDPRQIVLIYSTGRCGSTLVSRAFSQADSVVSFSEPDVFTQILTLREPDGSTNAEVGKLVHSCTKVMCASGAQGGASAWALKFRSFVIELGDLFYRNFPEAKVIFLYRNAEAWARSSARAFHLFDPQMALILPLLQQAFIRLVPLVAEYTAKNTATISPMELLTCMWVSVMERCLELQRQGVPMFAARYEELQTAPRETLAAMFGYCGVSASTSEAIESVLQRDSQEGSSLSRASAQESSSELTQQHLMEMHQLMREYSPTLTPDFIVPNTFRPASR